MAKKKQASETRNGGKPRPKARTKASSGKGRKGGLPDTSVLARYSPTDSAASHPEWVKTQFPSYVGPHAGHEQTSVREFSHGGHVVRIITTYRIEVDGKPVQAHLSVDEDGQVFTHATPFVTYGSAVDLMKAVLDAYPTSFPPAEEGGQGGGEHGEGGHGEGGHGGTGHGGHSDHGHEHGGGA